MSRRLRTWFPSVCGSKSLTIYQQVYPQKKLGNARAERALLETLHKWVPLGVPVIIITDAGFLSTFFIGRQLVQVLADALPPSLIHRALLTLRDQISGPHSA